MKITCEKVSSSCVGGVTTNNDFTGWKWPDGDGKESTETI